MISVKIKFKDKDYYKYADAAFIDDAGMEKAGEGIYRSPDGSSDDVMIWTSLDGIVTLFKNKWFKDITESFTRDVAGEEEDLFECYDFMVKEGKLN